MSNSRNNSQHPIRQTASNEKEIKVKKIRLGSLNDFDRYIKDGYRSKQDVLWESINTKNIHMTMR